MPLAELKQVVLRLIAAESIRPAGLAAELEAQNRIASQILATFLDLEPIEAQLTSSESTVQDVVTHQLARVDGLATDLPAADRRRFERFVRAIREHSGQLCKQCTQPPQDPCRDDPQRDAELLDKRGLCIRKINECYLFMLAVAKRVIDSWGFVEGERSDTCEVLLERRFIGSPDRAAPPAGKRHHIRATTRFEDPDEGGRRRTVIKVELDGRFFDRPSLLSAPSVFAHELLAHAFQGRTGLKREEWARDCPFYQGWMDEVAFRLLVEAVYGRLALLGRPIVPATLIAQNPRDVVKEAMWFHEGRWGPSNPDGTYPYPMSHWQLGSLAVEDLYQFFVARNQLNDPHRTALKLLCRLSFRIQALNPDPREALQIATCLGLLAQQGRQCPDPGGEDADEIYDIIWQDQEIAMWIRGLQRSCRKWGLWDDTLYDSFDN